jgi:hypothetical protein
MEFRLRFTERLEHSTCVWGRPFTIQADAAFGGFLMLLQASATSSGLYFAVSGVPCWKNRLVHGMATVTILMSAYVFLR